MIPNEPVEDGPVQCGCLPLIQVQWITSKSQPKSLYSPSLITSSHVCLSYIIYYYIYIYIESYIISYRYRYQSYHHTLSNPVTPSQISLKRLDAAKQLPNKCCSLPGSFVGHAVQNQNWSREQQHCSFGSASSWTGSHATCWQRRTAANSTLQTLRRGRRSSSALRSLHPALHKLQRGPPWPAW